MSACSDPAACCAPVLPLPPVTVPRLLSRFQIAAYAVSFSKYTVPPTAAVTLLNVAGTNTSWLTVVIVIFPAPSAGLGSPFVLTLLRPPTSPHFPYTTLFRSCLVLV